MVTNQLYWIAASSWENGELRRAKWDSILPHVGNIHEGHSELFPKCAHGTLTYRKWLKPGIIKLTVNLPGYLVV